MKKSGVTHYSYDALLETVAKSACGAWSDRHEYTERVDLVNCTKCLKALGYTVD